MHPIPIERNTFHSHNWARQELSEIVLNIICILLKFLHTSHTQLHVHAHRGINTTSAFISLFLLYTGNERESSYTCGNNTDS